MNIKKISPKYDATKLSIPTLEDYIDVCEDQINGWYLNYAKEMHSDQHAGFAALQIAFSYFEGHAILYKGEDSKNKSPQFFREGLLSVFPELHSMNEDLKKSTICIMYTDGRCGFFHAGITRSRFILRDAEDGEPIIRVESDPATQKIATRVFLDRRKFVDRVCQHFSEYIVRLRNSNETKLRQNFEKAQRILHGQDMPLKTN